RFLPYNKVALPGMVTPASDAGGPSRGCRAVGVSLLYPRPPLGPTHLELTPGLTVLYGLNGAGKTQVLRLVEDAFGGRPTNYRVNLHLHVGEQSTAAMTAFGDLADDLRRRVETGSDSEQRAGVALEYSWTGRVAPLLQALDVPAPLA